MAQWQRSGLSVREFAVRLGVKRGTFAHWVWQLRASTTPARAEVAGGARFVEVVGAVAGSAPKGTTRSAGGESLTETIEVVLRDGLRVRVGWPTDSGTAGGLVALIVALEAR